MEFIMLTQRLIQWCFGIGLVSCLFLPAGCENKFTRERWEMIRVNSSDKTEVEMTLGAPQEQPFKDLWWYYKGNREAKIYFTDKDVVKAKKWINTRTGEIIVEPKGWIEK